MSSQTLMKTFDNGVTVKATYFEADELGKVWLQEEWVKDGQTITHFVEPEPWLAPNVGTVARRHDWGLYPDAMHL